MESDRERLNRLTTDELKVIIKYYQLNISNEGNKEEIIDEIIQQLDDVDPDHVLCSKNILNYVVPIVVMLVLWYFTYLHFQVSILRFQLLSKDEHVGFVSTLLGICENHSLMFERTYAEGLIYNRNQHLTNLGISKIGKYKTSNQKCTINLWTINKLVRLCQKKYHPDKNNGSHLYLPQYIQCNEASKFFQTYTALGLSILYEESDNQSPQCSIDCWQSIGINMQEFNKYQIDVEINEEFCNNSKQHDFSQIGLKHSQDWKMLYTVPHVRQFCMIESD
jgi:hypothetical protein